MRLALEGARVVCIARTRSQLEATVDRIKANVRGSGADAIAIPFDLCDIDGIPSLVQDIHQRLGGNTVDILVNNAGIARVDALECQPDMKMWQQVLTTNLTAPVALTTALLPSMLSAGHGTIISMGSRCAVLDVPYLSAYSASKTALLRFHHNLHSEVGARGTRNYYLQPGDVATEIEASPTFVDPHSLTVEGVRRTANPLPASSMRSPETVADVCVKLLLERGAESLSGMYVDMDGDIAKVVEDLRRGSDSEVRRRGLYRLKLETI